MRRTFLLFCMLSRISASEVQAAVPDPSEFLKMNIGADRVLADYRQMSTYLRALDASSPRVQVESLGRTTLGEDMLMVVISSEENIRDLEAIKATSKRLSDPRNLSPEQIDDLVIRGKTVVLVTCNIHSSEIASSQMALEWAHDLAAAEDPETKRRLENVVLLLIPSLNPDGQIMEVEWYRKQLGSRYEGSGMPWLYHHYVGHDNNRDWFMLTQRETRNLSRMIYHEWFPQLFIDEHQMGSDGPRMFIPPFADPADSDVHPLIWREVNLIGSMMAFRLEQKQKSGIIYGYAFDAYWIGGTRNTGWWKNITGLLLEVASARMATPIYIEPSELSGGRKGLIDYKAQTNHPNPWKGGWWRMRDIMDYERIASDALLETAATRREDFLRNLVVRARAAVADATPGEAYRIPAAQRDYPAAKRLADLMADHGVEVLTAEGASAMPDFYIPLAQPYSRFVREMLEPQRYPEVRVSSGPGILRPYDVATWTLPLMMGVTVEKTTLPGEPMKRLVAPILEKQTPNPSSSPLPDAKNYSLSAGSAASAEIVNRALQSGGAVWLSPDEGKFFIDRPAAEKISGLAAQRGVALTPQVSVPQDAARLKKPRVATYKPWTSEMDEGWTRWILEQYEFVSSTLSNEQIRAGKLRDVDVIILPHMEKELIDKGKEKVEEGGMTYFALPPPEYRGGLGKSGAKALSDFVENGGTLIAFAAASEYVMEEFNIPVRNSLAKVKAEDFSVPGSLLKVHLTQGHPITAGMAKTVAAFVDEKLAFETLLPGAEMQRWVLASYPETGSDILLSGWIEGEEKLRRRAAAVAMTYGKGRIVLFGFRPQHRAQTHATFPLLFNSIYWSIFPQVRR